MKFWLYLLLIPSLHAYDVFLVSSTRLIGVEVTGSVMSSTSSAEYRSLTSDNHFGVTLSADQNYLYVPNATANTISIFQVADFSLVTTINPGSSLNRPQSVVLSPNGRYFYVANRLANNIVIVDAASYALVTTINPGSSLHDPRGMAVSPDGTTLFVTNESSNTISLIRLSDNSLTGTINPSSTLSGPFGIAFSPDGGSIYVSNRTNSTISIINARTYELSSLLTFSGSHSLCQIAFAPDGEFLYVTDIASGTPKIQILSYPGHIWQSSVNPSGAFIGSPSGIAISPIPRFVREGSIRKTQNFTSKRM